MFGMSALCEGIWPPLPIAETRRGRRNDFLYLATIALIGVLLFVAAVAATVWLVSRLVMLIEGA